MIENNKNHSRIGLDKLIFDMLEKLPERSKNIIIKRFDLDRRGAKTLDEIGKEYGITRERVRQIEAESILKLKKIGGEDPRFKEALDYVEKIIEERGGIISENEIIKIFFPNGGENDEKAKKQLVLSFLSLDDRMKEAKESKFHKKLYFYKEENFNRFREMIKNIEAFLLGKKQNVDFGRISELMNEKAKKENHYLLSPKAIESYLEANEVILKNILEEWGHKDWLDINPKSARDKSYLILKKSREPLHFVEIADRINDIWGEKRKANKQTVHNELIKDKRFVLVGRGIYALREWGYAPGTVLDVIIDILKKAGKEMTQEEIVQEVLKRRKVRKNTIVINLQNRNHFEKLTGKIYKLK